MEGLVSDLEGLAQKLIEDKNYAYAIEVIRFLELLMGIKNLPNNYVKEKK